MLFCTCDNNNFLRPATLAFGRPRDGSHDDDGTRRAPKMQLFSTNCDDSNGDPDVDDRCAFDSAKETALCPSSCLFTREEEESKGVNYFIEHKEGIFKTTFIPRYKWALQVSAQGTLSFQHIIADLRICHR